MPQHPFLEEHGAHTELVVALHGFSSSAQRLLAIRETITEKLPDADIFAPKLPLPGGWFSLKSAESIVAELMREINAIVAARDYQKISFVGHSFGAVLARRLVVTAFGQQYDKDGDCPAPFEAELAQFATPSPWAGKIRRLVLLAGMNRGWTVSSALDWMTSVIWSVFQFIGESIPFGRPTIFAIRRGAPFLVQTRLQWLALMNPDYAPHPPATMQLPPRPDLITVQLLGTGDDQVSPDDNVDYAVDLFGGVGTQSFFYIEVPYSTHPDVVQMAKSGPKRTEPVRKLRRDKFITALTAPTAQLESECVTRDQMADNLPPLSDPAVTDVVFVVHGIRDKGFWTQKIARTIKKLAPNGRKIESWTESYGYFAMLPFILRRVRQRKVEWLMDCYAEARARYPNAAFHYVGHSNGTYLAAQALQDYPAARFKHIVFAGSVVRRNYDWLRLINRTPPEQPRVRKVLNYVATRDWVVALFPKGLQPWQIFNLGSAGHDGFSQSTPQGPVQDVRYIVGSHGAGHEEQNWNNIARFIITGNSPAPTNPPVFAGRQSYLWRALGGISFVLFPLMVIFILAAGVTLFWSIAHQLPALACSDAWFVTRWLSHWSACAGPPVGNQQALRSLGFAIYLLIVTLFVTQF